MRHLADWTVGESIYRTFLLGSSRGSPVARVGPYWAVEASIGQPLCLPLPPLGLLPSETVVDNRSLSRLLHIFTLSVPPPSSS